jgi:hypothetical protein
MVRYMTRIELERECHIAMKTLLGFIEGEFWHGHPSPLWASVDRRQPSAVFHLFHLSPQQGQIHRLEFGCLRKQVYNIADPISGFIYHIFYEFLVGIVLGEVFVSRVISSTTGDCLTDPRLF